MNRKEVVKKFTSLLGSNDLVIFIGKELCEEAYLNDRENYIYLLNNFFISAAVGLAYSVPDNYRVFVVFTDPVLIEDFSSIFQVFLSRNRNLFLVFFYNTEALFKSVSHIQGVFFDIGIQSFAISSYFNSAEGLKKLKLFLKEMTGPKIYSMAVEASARSKVPSIDKLPELIAARFNLFVNKVIGETTNGV